MDPSAIEERIAALKEEALQLRESGDKLGAVRKVREMKALRESLSPAVVARVKVVEAEVESLSPAGSTEAEAQAAVAKAIAEAEVAEAAAKAMARIEAEAAEAKAKAEAEAAEAKAAAAKATAEAEAKAKAEAEAKAKAEAAEAAAKAQADAEAAEAVARGAAETAAKAKAKAEAAQASAKVTADANAKAEAEAKAKAEAEAKAKGDAEAVAAIAAAPAEAVASAMPTAPGAHDAGIEYGEIAPDIAADNMAAHIAAIAAKHEVFSPCSEMPPPPRAASAEPATPQRAQLEALRREEAVPWSPTSLPSESATPQREQLEALRREEYTEPTTPKREQLEGLSFRHSGQISSRHSEQLEGLSREAATTPQTPQTPQLEALEEELLPVAIETTGSLDESPEEGAPEEAEEAEEEAAEEEAEEEEEAYGFGDGLSPSLGEAPVVRPVAVRAYAAPDEAGMSAVVGRSGGGRSSVHVPEGQPYYVPEGQPYHGEVVSLREEDGVGFIQPDGASAYPSELVRSAIAFDLATSLSSTTSMDQIFVGTPVEFHIVEEPSSKKGGKMRATHVKVLLSEPKGAEEEEKEEEEAEEASAAAMMAALAVRKTVTSAAAMEEDIATSAAELAVKKLAAEGEPAATPAPRGSDAGRMGLTPVLVLLGAIVLLPLLAKQGVLMGAGDRGAGRRAESALTHEWPDFEAIERAALNDESKKAAGAQAVATLAAASEAAAAKEAAANEAERIAAEVAAAEELSTGRAAYQASPTEEHIAAEREEAKSLAAKAAAALEAASAAVATGTAEAALAAETALLADAYAASESSSAAKEALPRGLADTSKQCPTWAASGECMRNPSYMASACALSCRLAQAQEASPVAANQPDDEVSLLRANARRSR